MPIKASIRYNFISNAIDHSELFTPFSQKSFESNTPGKKKLILTPEIVTK